jgi:hypothetical protein
VASFELNWRKPIVVAVAPHRVVEYLNVLEDIAPGSLARSGSILRRIRSRLRNWKKLSATALS